MPQRHGVASLKAHVQHSVLFRHCAILLVHQCACACERIQYGNEAGAKDAEEPRNEPSIRTHGQHGIGKIGEHERFVGNDDAQVYAPQAGIFAHVGAELDGGRVQRDEAGPGVVHPVAG